MHKATFTRLTFLLLSTLIILLLTASNVKARSIPTIRSAIVSTNAIGETVVIDSNTQNPVPQAPATDGGGLVQGNHFSLPPLLWIVVSGIIGVSMAVAGIRGSRLTAGTAIGLSLVLPVWAALVNGINATGLGPTQQSNDVMIILVLFIVFALGFGISFFRFGIQTGSVAAGVVGGLAFAFRIVTLKDGLLIPIYPLNWVLIVLFSILGLSYVCYDHRMGVIVSTASIGSFLSFLSVDLIVHGASGFSKGLRFLLDRNLAHAADLQTYQPGLTTQLLIGGSILSIPLFAFAQHKLFPGPFDKSEDLVTKFGRNSRTSTFLMGRSEKK